MPQFLVEYLDSQGRKNKTQIEATSANDAILKMKIRGYKPISVRETVDVNPAQPNPSNPQAVATPQKPSTGKFAVKTDQKPEAKPETGGLPSFGAPTAVSKPRRAIIISGRVRHRQLAQFTHQFSVLLEAGLPIVRSLKILQGQFRPGLLKSIVGELSEDVETGSSLSEALAKHPKAFDKLFVNMVRAGEAGGILEEVLKRLAEFMEKMEALKRKVISASIYPAVVITIAMIVVLAIMTFIVPKFEEVFEAVNVPMPGMTLVLMKISGLIKQYWFVLIFSPFVFFAVLKAWSRTKSGKLILDRTKLQLPVVGPLVRKSITARFCRTLGTLLKSGVPILECLSIVKGATGNEVVTRAIATVHDSVREGESVAAPLQACGVFDDMVINMIDVGEETGELDAMLIKIADIYDSEVDTSVSGLVSILEPMLIVGLGFCVGFIVISLFLPLVSLITGITQKK